MPAIGGLRALELDPNFAVAYETLSLAHARLGQYDKSLAALEQGAALPGSTSAFLFPWFLALAGDREEARRRLRAVIERVGDEDLEGYPGMFIGAAYATLSEMDNAYRVFRKAVEERRYSALLLCVEQAYDRFRSDPRFGELRKMVGLPEPTT